MQKEIQQNSIWLVKLEDKQVGHEQYGDRPFYVISSTEYNKKSETPIGFFLSTSESKSKNIFTLQLTNKGWVNISQIRTLDISRFIEFKENTNSSNLEAKIISKFLNQIIFNGQLDDTEFINIFKKNNNKNKETNFMNNFGTSIK